MMDESTIKNLAKHGFEYISALGEGGFGQVVKVKHQLSDQFYAVKTLHKTRVRQPENILREIKAIAQLNNPNIISYNHSFIEDGTLYLVMEYCSKGSLRDWLIKAGKLDIKTATDIFLRLTHTFAFLHSKGFIHHDIKPDNLLFTDDKIKISDFGTVNTSIGTIIYSAPEMLMDNPPVNDVRVDVFSLGLTFMECLTGKNPLAIAGSESKRTLIVKKADFPIGGLPYWLQQLLLKACHYDPSVRFQTMVEFHEAISKRHIPQIIDDQVIATNKQTQVLKMHIIRKRWNFAKNYIETFNNESIGFLIEKGKYYLGINQLDKAQVIFELVLKRDRHAPITKNMAEIYLQHQEPSKAATILHGYILHHFNDIEAHNQLLYSYFLSDQWELGLEQSAYLRKLFPKEILFINNHALFELLLRKEPTDMRFINELNPFAYYNYHEVVLGNNPPAYQANDSRSLKTKLLFQEFKFRNIHKSKNAISVEVDGNGVITDCSRHIISFGREGYDYNTFSLFDDTMVSRRHFVIVNQKNNIWLYNMSGLGTVLNGVKIMEKAYIPGRCEIQLGQYQVVVNPDTKLLF